MGWTTAENITETTDLPSRIVELLRSHIRGSSSNKNNAVEGWHRGFDALTTRYHESLWETIENFKREHTFTEMMVAQDNAGGPPAKKRRRTMNAESRLASVVLKYEDISGGAELQDYLQGVTSNLSY